MKILETNDEIAAAEKAVRESEALYKKESEAYFASLREDPSFKKYVIEGIINKELNRITNLEWMYESELLGKSSNSQIGEILRRNSVVFRVLKNILKPILRVE
ncbi:MAG: hypothetical protein IPO02_11990 [Bacteroidetes bacterium]|nr:hypothetical protein [Bacteroidota bacterium]